MRTIGVPRLLRHLVIVSATLLALSCGGSEGGTVDPPGTDDTPAQVLVSPATDTLNWINATRQMSAQVLNGSGGRVSATVTWTSLASGVVDISSSGMATAVGVGVAQVTAQAGSASGSATLVVRQVASAMEKRQGDAQTAAAGALLSEALEIRVVDQGGTPVPGAPLTWAVSSGGGSLESSSSATDASGLGRAVWRLGSDVGAQMVQVSSGSLSASFTATATGATTLSITGVSPAVLKEGASATVLGSGFASGASQNQVTVDGLAATVTAASATSLTFVVPTSDCRPPHQGQLSVAVGGSSASKAVAVTPDTLLALASTSGWYTTEKCIHLAAGSGSEAYLVGVLSLSETPSSLTPSRVTLTAGSDVQGTATVAPSPLAQQSVFVPSALRRGRFGSHVSRGLSAAGAEVDWAGHRAAETRRREEESDLIRRLGPAPATSSIRADAAASAVPAKGDTLTFNVPTVASCSEGTSVRAVVRHVGIGGLWLEDVDNPVESFTDAEYKDLDDFYSQVTDKVLADYFGSFVDLDGNQRTVVLLTKEVNQAENTLGYVWAADLYPKSMCGTSNEAEIFYGQVPDPEGKFGVARTKEQVAASYPSLVAHEITHVRQRTQQVHRGAGDKSIWQLEGGATLAEQLVGYQVMGHASGQDLGPDQFWASGASDWYMNWATDLAKYFGWTGDSHAANAPEQCSWMGAEDDGNTGPCLNLRAVYGVPSMFLRFVLDRYGPGYSGGEKALMRALTSSSGGGGLSDFADLTGEPASRIMTLFGITLWADGRVWNSMTSWNLYELFQSFTETARLKPYSASSAEPTLSVSVRAGSNAYLEWSPPSGHAPTSIRVRTPSGDALPDYMVLWILRVR